MPCIAERERGQIIPTFFAAIPSAFAAPLPLLILAHQYQYNVAPSKPMPCTAERERGQIIPTADTAIPSTVAAPVPLLI